MAYLKFIEDKEGFVHWDGATEQEIEYAEQELGISFPLQYKTFLSQCGMCNWSDVCISGIAKDSEIISYPIIELTKEIQKQFQLSMDWIVLSYEVGEYLILYKIPVGNNLKDSSIWGADVYWEDDTPHMSKPVKLYDSFMDYFKEFLKYSETES